MDARNTRQLFNYPARFCCSRVKDSEVDLPSLALHPGRYGYHLTGGAQYFFQFLKLSIEVSGVEACLNQEKTCAFFSRLPDGVFLFRLERTPYLRRNRIGGETVGKSGGCLGQFLQQVIVEPRLTGAQRMQHVFQFVRSVAKLLEATG